MMKARNHFNMVEDNSEGDIQLEKEGLEVAQPAKKGRLIKLFLLFLTFLFLVITIGVAIIYFKFQPEPGRTSFLILGAAGEDHAGGDLTDTIIFLSIDNLSGKALLLSLPRDIWLASLRTKLNAVYHYQGLKGAKDSVEEILGQKVNYAVLVDFNVFTDLIDILGGVQIKVEESFDDFRFPIPGKENDLCDGDPDYGCRYEHVHFEDGWQEMNARQALKFVRSRFAEGEQGTDFARSQRQQQLISAITTKILSLEILKKPKKLPGLLQAAQSRIRTDIPQEGYLDLLKVAKNFSKNDLRMEVLNDGYLISPPPSQTKYDGQWVLVPSSGDWEEIHGHVESLLIF
ncbi:LCP family protein [Patescibacteria group bacterium]